MSDCILCKSPLDPDPVLSLGKQVYVNTYVEPDSNLSFQPQPLDLCVCSNSTCRHLQLSHLAPPERLFSNYFWTTGTASTTRSYSHVLADEIHSLVPGASSIVEIASNDGTFLHPFKRLGLSVLGVEPAENIASSAIQSGIPTIVSFFDNTAVEASLSHLNTNPDIILARNVIPHTPNPHELVSSIAALASPSTSVFVEIHCFESIFSDLQFDSIYHEHYSYFSFFTLCRLFASYNFQPVFYKRTPISGGSLLVQFKLSSESSLDTDLVSFLSSSRILHSKNSLSDFKRRCIQHSSRILKLVDSQLALYPDLPLYSFGSSARGNTIITHLGLSSKITALIDSSPLKWGQFSVNTGLQVLSIDSLPSDQPLCCI